MKMRILGLIVVMVLAMMVVVPAYATPATSVNGEILPLGPDNGLLTGAFSGTYTIVETQGNVSRLFFEGTLDGSAGTLLLNLVEVGPKGLGYWTILESTGDLAGLHGQGTFMFSSETSGSYQGQVHTDP